MKATFENSVSVLVRAYYDDTLVHGDCNACAVGNLIAAANALKMVRVNNPDNTPFMPAFRWLNQHGTHIHIDWICPVKAIQYKLESCNHETSTAEILAVGYSLHQLLRIENAFERAERHGDWMFNGLMAVVEVLADIHQVDLSVKEQAIGQFKEVQLAKA